MTQLIEPLRICRKCGLEAHTEEDLGQFTKHKTLPHGRSTICKPCFNEYRKQRRDNVTWVYLLHKFKNLKNRCISPNHTLYYRYGGRGIIVCDEWLNDPDAFVDWALVSGWVRGLTIDRVNTEGPYSPENCRWATMEEQNRNRRDNTTFFEKETRICSKCKVEKPLTKFHRDHHNSKDRQYACKKCRNAYNRKKYHEKKLHSTHGELTGSQSDSAVSSKEERR